MVILGGTLTANLVVAMSWLVLCSQCARAVCVGLQRSFSCFLWFVELLIQILQGDSTLAHMSYNLHSFEGIR